MGFFDVELTFVLRAYAAPRSHNRNKIRKTYLTACTALTIAERYTGFMIRL
jgi:hypothetical protein